jgi:transcriptional regulator with XRE-family HTH domain
MLAIDAGIDRTYVSRLERGVENPTVRMLEKLARALSSNIEDLFKVPDAGEATPGILRGGRQAAKTESGFVAAAPEHGSRATVPLNLALRNGHRRITARKTRRRR